jgi:hypothetical protein
MAGTSSFNRLIRTKISSRDGADLQFPYDQDVEDENEDERDGKGQRERVERERSLSVHVLALRPVNVATDDGLSERCGRGGPVERRHVGRRQRGGVAPWWPIGVDLLCVSVQKDGHDHQKRSSPRCRRHHLFNLNLSD